MFKQYHPHLLSRPVVRFAIAATALVAGSAASGFSGVFDAGTQKALQSLGGSLISDPKAISLPSISGSLENQSKAPSQPAAGKQPTLSSATKDGLNNPKAYEFAYSPQISMKVRDEVIQELVNLGKRKGTMDAKAEQQLRAHFGNIDLIKSLEPTLKAKGYNINSTATGLAFWLLTNYSIIHGITTTDTQNNAVLKQMQERISATPALADMNDAQRQRTSEALIWFASLQQYAYEEAQKGSAGFDMKTTTDDARQALKSFGIDADRITLTDQGIMPR